MSRPLRLVQQAAQPVEFCCPLCGSEHAAYHFGTGQFRIFRCGGCALTFSKPAPRGRPADSTPRDASERGNRNERDHAGLLAAFDAAKVDKSVLLVAGPQEGLGPLLEQRGITVG